ncbi:penicillin-binding protein [Sphaerisporangium rufum]|uniref:Penicillin-binding protein n=1 Tax=Sphaerisporangium rufum TaxID=1381558 RepID=A0A919UX02_9ACTN|nr:penicillin-binding transpeptidase domain-containing protein [Sphaerisporangium rufum]GII75344.1 penicillin-binding protein [Sphaerisporangium rufum]
MASSARRALAAALSLAALAPATACFAEPSPHNAVGEFLVGWQTGDFAAAARRTDGDPAKVAKALEQAGMQLDAASIRFSLHGLRTDGDNADAALRVFVDLGDNNPLWRFDNHLPLHLVDGTWKVRWSPGVIHPQLREGQRFAVKISPESRKPIEDRTGEPLQQEQTLFVAGVHPSGVQDPEGVCERLFQLTGFAQDRLLSRIRSAPPQDFVPLVTFGAKKYAQLSDRLDEIPGLQVKKQPQPVAPAQPADIIGRVSAITPESEQQLGGPQLAGDTVGQNGLQKAYQDQLTGSTGTKVITYDLKTNEQVAELASWPGRRGVPSVRTTLDRGVQMAADLAVNGAGPAALVAVQASTGKILAVGSQQLDQETDALNGRFPPGTTFSIIAADGLLKAGLDPGQKVPCPADRTVGGARFQQTAAPAGTSPSVTTGFAYGCVTALASLARRIDTTALAEAAGRYGIGREWSLPLRSFSGQVPKVTGEAGKAKVIAGQSVRVSPLSMALVAGALASGAWRPPSLVTSPASPDLAADVKPVAQPQPMPLDPKTLPELRRLMRAGVTSGSAAAAAAPGEPVHGVVSTVRFDDGKRRRELSWFVGWQGDVAVSVLLEAADPAAAARVAGRFFRGAGQTG